MPCARVGQIAFLNCAPLDLGLARGGATDDLELVRGTPVELARLLRAGELDVAPLSLIEYLRHADDFLLLPDMAIGAAGAVRSVQLVGAVAPDRLRGPVALTDESATSHVLLAILLAELWGVSVASEVRAVEYPATLRQAEAALVIGDQALRLAAERPTGLHMTDLGSAWAELTGLPMVFAVWAVRRDFALAEPALTALAAERLAGAMAWGRANLDQAAAVSSRDGSFSAAFLRSYFDGLDFGLGQAAERGLHEFAARAREHGFLAGEPSLEFLESPRMVGVAA